MTREKCLLQIKLSPRQPLPLFFFIESHEKVVMVEAMKKSTRYKITLPIQIFLIKNSASDDTNKKCASVFEAAELGRLKSYVLFMLRSPGVREL
jgi:hypothetical protein